MPEVTIYHNPRCSKSRQTLALLKERGVVPTVIEYLNDPPDAATLKAILAKLGIRANELVREKEWNELGLPVTDNEDQLILRIADHPQIVQRPIVVAGEKAAIGRPPENVLAIL